MAATDDLIQLKNCRLIRNHQIVQQDLWIRAGKIIDPESVFFDEKTVAQHVYDCENSLVSAGFIDIQINGTKILLIYHMLTFELFS